MGATKSVKSAKESGNVVRMVGMTQEALYNTVMDNARPYAVGRSKNQIGIYAVPLALCYVDERYQGLREHRQISKLERKWDERKLAPIILVPHPEEYRFAIVDGQGRVRVAEKLGYESLQAIILLNAPQDPDERLRFEAELFISQDDEIEKVKSLEKHPARVIIGDEAATILEGMFKKYGIKYTDTRGAREVSVLGSYPTTYAIAKSHGVYCLDFIFSIIKNAGWDKEPNGYATYVTEALKDVWLAFHSREERNAIHTYLSDRFRDIDPTLFSSKARARYPMRRDTRACCKLYVEDMICNGLGLKKPDKIA